MSDPIAKLREQSAEARKNLMALRRQITTAETALQLIDHALFITETDVSPEWQRVMPDQWALMPDGAAARIAVSAPLPISFGSGRVRYNEMEKSRSITNEGRNNWTLIQGDKVNARGEYVTVWLKVVQF